MGKGHKTIKCRICGNKFSTLITHINRAHGISSREYKRRFPKSELITNEFRKNQSSSAKSRFLSDPLLRQKVASRTFDFINNKKLTPLLQRDYKTAKTCLVNKLYKPSILLYGSLIEAILMEKHQKANNFFQAIEIAYKTKDISEKEYHKIHLVRDLRNFVHLHKELSEGAEINDYWAKTFADICESIIKRFK